MKLRCNTIGPVRPGQHDIASFAFCWNRKAAAILFFLMGLAAWPGPCLAQLTASQGTEVPKTEPCGLFSDFILRPSVSPQVDPTAIWIMPSRYEDLKRTQEGYARTGIDLLSYDEVHQRFTPAGYSDSPGIYYYIPMISRVFHTDLARSVSLFFITTMALSVILGGWGLMLALENRRSKMIGVIALCLLSCIVYRLGDVYIFEFALPIVLIPWILHYVRRKSFNWVTGGVLFLAGAAVGIAETVRTDAAIPTLVFALALLLTRFKSVTFRGGLFACLVLAGLLLPLLNLQAASRARDSFLLQQGGWEREDLSRHAFWHFAYVGLGFLSNKYVPGGVCDEAGIAKVRAIAPEAPYLSRQYNQVLRDEVLSIAKQSPLLMLFSIAAKLGIVVVMIAVFANLGLVAAVFEPKPWEIELAFWMALAVSALPLIIVAPLMHYLVGLVSLAAVYGVFSVDQALTVKVAAVTPSRRREAAVLVSSSEASAS